MSSPLGEAIRRARKGRNPKWSQARLAREAQRLAPASLEITEQTVDRIEKARTTIRIDGDGNEPICYVLKALGMDGTEVLRAIGMLK